MKYCKYLSFLYRSCLGFSTESETLLYFHSWGRLRRLFFVWKYSIPVIVSMFSTPKIGSKNNPKQLHSKLVLKKMRNLSNRTTNRLICGFLLQQESISILRWMEMLDRKISLSSTCTYRMHRLSCDTYQGLTEIYHVSPPIFIINTTPLTNTKID